MMVEKFDKCYRIDIPPFKLGPNLTKGDISITVVVHSLGTLSYLGQSAIFKSAKKSVTWDTRHSAILAEF